MAITKTIYTDVEVDIDLEDFSDDEILAEAEKRNLDFDRVDLEEDITAMFEAFYIGKTEQAIELARKVAQDVTGRLL
jgi:hypothetical protein